MKIKIKNCLLRRFLYIGLALLMLFSTVPVFAAMESPFNDTTLETLTDEEGFNFIGNTPELRAMGGFYAVQKDWLFYADWTQNGVLCAASADGKHTHTLTDYPVANINVVGDMLVFTDISATVSRSYGADTEFAHNKLTYGGRLYQAQGVKALMSGGELGEMRQTGGDAAYYHVNLGGETIFALSGSADGESFGTDWSYVQVLGGEVTTLLYSGGGERIVNLVDNYLVAYLEVEFSDKWGYIVRVDPMTGELVDTLPGRELSVLGERIFFISNTNHYLYELKNNTAEPTVVSSCPIASYAIQDNGDIKALGADGFTQLLISLNGGYPGFAGPYQVGEWYNYFKIEYPLPKEPIEPQEVTATEWVIHNQIIIDYLDPPKPPNPPKPPKPPKPPNPPEPPQEDIMPPEVAVEMVMTIIKGGTTEDDIFNKYYDANAKATFMEYFAKIYDDRLSLETALKEGMAAMGEDLFTEEHREKFYLVFKDYFQQIKFSLKTQTQTADAATVQMHLTQTLDLDSPNANFNETVMLEYISNYLAGKGLDMSYLYSFSSEQELMGFMLDVMVEYMREVLVPVKVSKYLDFHLKTDSVLGWVITNPEILQDLEESPNGGGYDYDDGGGDDDDDEDGNGNGNGNGNDNGNGNGNGGGNGGGSTTDTDDKSQGGDRPPGMQCVYKKVLYEREAPNVWEVLGRDAKKLWNDFWGIETPRYEPVDHYLKDSPASGSPLPGRDFCPNELQVIVPGKPKSTWEMIKGWFS